MRHYYRIVKGRRQELTVGGFGLDRYEPDQAETERLDEEISKWMLVMKYEYEYEDLVYDDRDTGVSYELYCEPDVVIMDGRFVGYLVRASSTSSYGMSVSRTDDMGIVFIDGQTAGTTGYHLFHCSTETSKKEDGTFMAVLKEDFKGSFSRYVH